jgi:hypothetical protein
MAKAYHAACLHCSRGGLHPRRIGLPCLTRSAKALQYPQDGAVPGRRRPKTHQPGKEISMNASRIAGIILIVAGLAGFFTGGFSFTKDRTAAKLGPLELTVTEKESVNIPQWLSLGAVVLGAALLVMGSRKS